MPGSLTLPSQELHPKEKRAMKLFIVATALLIGLAQGVPIAQKAAITVPKLGELSSALVARYINVTIHQRSKVGEPKIG